MLHSSVLCTLVRHKSAVQSVLYRVLYRKYKVQYTATGLLGWSRVGWLIGVGQWIRGEDRLGVYTVECTLNTFTVHCTLYTVICTMYNV